MDFSPGFDESALKYFISSAIATGILLLGISFVYGLSGELNYSLIDNSYFGQDTSLLFMLSCIFIICGLIFNVGCVPFHMQTPYILQGTSYPIGAYTTTIPVIAGFSALLRLVTYIMDDCPILQIIIGVLAVLTIFFGVFGAIRQDNFKRFMTFSR